MAVPQTELGCLESDRIPQQINQCKLWETEIWNTEEAGSYNDPAHSQELANQNLEFRQQQLRAREQS